MSAKSVPPELLDETIELFMKRRASARVAPKQQGRIAWFKQPGQPAIAYYWAGQISQWKIVIPNLNKFQQRQILRISPASPPRAGWEFASGFPAVEGFCTD